MMGWSVFPEVRFPEGFLDKLKEKTLEEQMQFYRIRVDSSVSDSSYGELDSERSWKTVYELENCRDLRELVEKDGLLAGVVLLSWRGKEEVCLPGHSVRVSSTVEDDGTGSSSRNDDAYLICV